MTRTAPESVRAELRRGLAWVEEGHGGGGLRPATIAWARRLAEGAEITKDKAVKMRAWLARHAVDKQGKGFSPGEEGYPSPGRVAWALWGGDPAVGWSARMVSSFEADMGKSYNAEERQAMADKGEAMPDWLGKAVLAKYYGYYGEAPELPYPLTVEGLTPTMRAAMPATMATSFVKIFNVLSEEGAEEQAAFCLAMESTAALGWQRTADGSYARYTMEGGPPEEPGEMEKAGRVLSAANEAKLRAAMDALAAVLGTAKPPEPKADTAAEKAMIKVDIERRTALGWASVVKDDDGNEVVDRQGDAIGADPEAGMVELADAMHDYMANSRVVKVNHGGPQVGTTVELLVYDDDAAELLKAAGSRRGVLYKRKYDTTPEGEAAWQAVRKGEHAMSSIGGTAAYLP